MIRTEQINVGTEDNPIMRYITYSTEGFLIERNGKFYSEAIDTQEQSYTETTQVIDENYDNDDILAYKNALNIIPGRSILRDDNDGFILLNFPIYVIAGKSYKRVEEVDGEEFYVKYMCVQNGVATNHNFRLFLNPLPNE